MSPQERWLDEAAGPVVRPYAVTKGRTRPTGEAFDLIAVVVATGSGAAGLAGLDGLGPEHLTLLRWCRQPTFVADLSADLDLPLGVIRILLADLRERGLVLVQSPPSRHQQPDADILKEVLNGLRAL
jgi:hypothetical protein